MHLVEISTKSTKNMGYAQVTQSPIGFDEPTEYAYGRPKRVLKLQGFN